MSTVQTAIDISPFHVDFAEEKLSDLRPRPERRRVSEPARDPRRVPERSR